MSSRRQLLQHTLASSAAWAGGTPLAALAAIEATPATRTALVIGNNRYRQNALGNAANDARAMAALLGQAGFAVDLKIDATRAQMIAGIDALGAAAARREVDTSLFFFAGHAAQLDWRNYLLPVDGDVESPGDIRLQCVDIGLLLDRLGRAKGKTALIILDACRDDPFGPRFRPSQKGMSPYDAPAGTLLAFATAPGRVAVEVQGNRNGLYTEHLVRELSVKGVRMEDALKRVRLNVRLASAGAQVPWESTSLERDVVLFPTPQLSAAELERQFREEFEAWTRIKGSPRLADWVDYLRRYPNGKFAEVAQVQLRTLLPAAPEPAARLASASVAKTPAPTAKAPALLLGPKLAVPARFKAPANPNSAGTYAFAPVWTPGDEYVFRELHLHSDAVLRTYKTVVRRVDRARNRVEFADGTLLDLMGGPLKEGKQRHYDVPIQINPAELQVGRTWETRFQQSGAPQGTGEYRFRITERQAVKVPAGEFHAFRVHGEGWFMGPFTQNRGTRLTRWLVPGLNVALRTEVHHQALARVLVSARQAVTGAAAL